MRTGAIRLGALTAELTSLDDEIRTLSHELDCPSDDCSQTELPVEEFQSPIPSKSHRLFAQSVSVLRKRTLRDPPETPTHSESPVIARKIATPANYQPPSERIDESRVKREKFRAEFEARRCQTETEECTFVPQKFSSYAIRHDKAQYDHHRKHCKTDESPVRWIDKNSERIAKTARPKKKEVDYGSDVSPQVKKYSPSRIQRSVERLTTPVKRFEEDPPDVEVRYADWRVNDDDIWWVRPPRGGWLHRGSRLRVACMPVVPLGSLTPCSVTPSLIA
jgi:hypothetical protein